MAARPSSLRDERSVNLSSGSSVTYMEGFGPCCSLLAVKSVWQHNAPTRDVLGLLEVFRRMVNESIRIGLANDVSSLRRLSLLSYNQLAHYDSPSCYKLRAISRAAGILASRKKSLRRGLPSRSPYAVRQQLVSCYSFKTKNGRLEIPISRGKRLSIPLTRHTINIISQPGVEVRSFTLTRNRLCLSIRRDDARIRRVIASKYRLRRTSRTGHLLHNATRTIVAVGVQQRTAIVLENIESIRRLYHKGNGQGRKYRGRMNGWSFWEAQWQIEYKARWSGLPIIRLSRRETRGSSVSCPRCGERLQSDKRLERKLWCGKCRIVMDRDRVAAVSWLCGDG